VAPLRKDDPGELFPWKALFRAGIGRWVRPEPLIDGPVLKLGDSGKSVGDLKQRFRRYGYGLGPESFFDDEMAAVVRAFQRHFRPERVDGVADLSTVRTLEQLLAGMPFLP
jgi:N-acetylmuramoyl-L-alanine amidase